MLTCYQLTNHHQVRAWFLSQSQAVPAPPPRRAAPLCRLRIALLVADGGGCTKGRARLGRCAGGSAGGSAGGGAATSSAAAAAAAAAAATLGREAEVEAEAEADAMPEGLALCFGQLALLFATGGGQASVYSYLY